MATAAVAKPAPAPAPALSLDQLFTWGKRLGKGSFGEVIVATDKKTGKVYAIKMVNKSKITSKHDVESLRREVRILKEVDHPNVMKLYNTFESDKNVFLQLEYCAGGDLFSRVIAKGVLSEDDARRYFTEALRGIAHLHSKKIVHRDVKPENLLMSSTAENANVKVADFGLSNIMDNTDILSTWCGSPAYMAPELVKGLKYNEKVDMWSLGVVLYVLLSGCYPFWADNSKEIYTQIKDGWFPMPDDIWGSVSEPAKDLIKKLIVIDPANRPSAEEALKHTWIVHEEPKSTEVVPEKHEVHNVRTVSDEPPSPTIQSPHRPQPIFAAAKRQMSFGNRRVAAQERVKKLKENIDKLLKTYETEDQHSFHANEAVVPLASHDYGNGSVIGR